MGNHLIFDMCTRQGIPIFYPFPHRPVVLPANPKSLIGNVPVLDLDAVMTKLYETSDSNPRKLRELCDRLRRELFIVNAITTW